MKNLYSLFVALLYGSVSALALNNDGLTDLYWRNPATLENQGWWLNPLGTGPIGMASVTLPPTGSDGPWRMVGVGDFDRDGQLDIVGIIQLTDGLPFGT
jgi:hypothetical protein